MKIIVDNLKSQIKTDNPEILKALYDRYSYTVPGAYFAKQQMGRRGKYWDGKKHFITKGGQFKTGLLDRILADLELIGCKPEIEWVGNGIKVRGGLDLTVEKIGKYTLRDWQRQFSILALGGTIARNIIKAPTGSGKTLLMAVLVQHLPLKTLILVTQKQLAYQTYDFLKKLGIDVGVCTGDGKSEGLPQVMVSTVQSIDHIVEDYHDCKMLIADEVHEFVSDDRSDILSGFTKAVRRYGFTATPPTDTISLLAIEGAIGPVYEIRSTQELIEDGSLTMPIIQAVEMPEPKGLALKTWNTYKAMYDNLIIKNKERNTIIATIVRTIMNKYDKPRIVIVVKELEHLEKLKDLIPYAHVLQGADTISERYSKIDKFTDAASGS